MNSMGKFPRLTVVDPASTAREPPSTLGDPGKRLWTQVMAEYDVSDVAGRQMLLQCCQMTDRAEDLAAEIATDGAVIRTREGIKDHPALKHELAARAFVVRTLCRLGLNFEPLHVNMGRPPGR
jgi:Phage terminase, small subunit